MIEIPSDIYSKEPFREGGLSPASVADHIVTSKKLDESQVKKTFIEAPQKFFGKYLEINIAKRTPEDKEANQAIRTEFDENLNAFFGPVLAEYLYPQEKHQQFLQKGAPLTPQCAQKIVSKGMEMMEALADSCKKSLADNAEKSSQPDLLDQAMIRYADEQEAIAAKQGGIIGLLPQTAKALVGGAMVGFAVATMGHLTPTDIFFLADLLADKKLSKSIENFITVRLVEHIQHHLEFYLEKRRNSQDPLTTEEEGRLRELLLGKTRSFSHESAYPSAKSGAIHTAALAIGLAPVQTPIDALKVIFQGETFATMGHNQLFRDGVIALIDNVKQIQESMSKRTVTTEELSKIKNAIAGAAQKAAAALAEGEGDGIWRDVSDKETLKSSGASVGQKKSALPPPWRRGI